MYVHVYTRWSGFQMQLWKLRKLARKKQNDILRKEILKKIGAVLAARQHDYDRFTSNRHLVLSKSLDQVLSGSGSLLRERPGRCSGGRAAAAAGQGGRTVRLPGRSSPKELGAESSVPSPLSGLNTVALAFHGPRPAELERPAHRPGWWRRWSTGTFAYQKSC